MRDHEDAPAGVDGGDPAQGRGTAISGGRQSSAPGNGFAAGSVQNASAAAGSWAANSASVRPWR